MNASEPDIQAEIDSSADTSLLFEVDEIDAGTRLDAYLAARIDGWSRSRLQRLIDDGDVLVNAGTVKSSYKLRAKDEIEVELPPPLSSSFTPEDIPLEIIYEDDDLVVVNKPAGMVVHPAAGAQSGTLANALAYHFQQLSAHAGLSNRVSFIASTKTRPEYWSWRKTKRSMKNLPTSFAHVKSSSPTWAWFMESWSVIAARWTSRWRVIRGIAPAWPWCVAAGRRFPSIRYASGSTGSHCSTLR